MGNVSVDLKMMRIGQQKDFCHIQVKVLSFWGLFDLAFRHITVFPVR